MTEINLKDEMNLDTLLIKGRVEKEYWIIPGKYRVTFRSLLVNESKELRQQILQGNLSDLDVMVLYLKKQIVEINGIACTEKEVEEKINNMASPLLDKILQAFTKFNEEINNMFVDEDKKKSGKTTAQ
ncbi:MAG: hypothetical protein QXG39_01935 [Candidatus Aenigmatarchaeota archaeon]